MKPFVVLGSVDSLAAQFRHVAYGSAVLRELQSELGDDLHGIYELNSNIDEDEDPHDVLDSLVEEFIGAFYQQAEMPAGELTVYRALRVRSIEDVTSRLDGFGVFWAWSIDGADTYFDNFDENYTGTIKVLCVGSVRPQDIDTTTTTFCNVVMAREREIRLEPGAAVQLRAVYDLKNGYADSLNGLQKLDIEPMTVRAAAETITLYHGTCAGNAEALLQHGWTPRSGAPMGANQGQPRLLYCTTVPKDALWFAEQKGCDTVLELQAVPLAWCCVDPEDGIGETVAEELEIAKRNGMPAKLAVKHPVPAATFRLHSGTAPVTASTRHSLTVDVMLDALETDRTVNDPRSSHPTAWRYCVDCTAADAQNRPSDAFEQQLTAERRAELYKDFGQYRTAFREFARPIAARELRRLPSGAAIKIYRVLGLDDGDSVDYDRLGRSWAFTKSGAINFSLSGDGPEGRRVWLSATVQQSAVDWFTTAHWWWLQSYGFKNDEREYELRIKPGAVLSDVEVTDGGTVLYRQQARARMNGTNDGV